MHCIVVFCDIDQAVATEKKREEEKQKRDRLIRDEMKREDGNRVEIWISPDGKASEGRVVDTLENELDFISTLEVLVLLFA